MCSISHIFPPDYPHPHTEEELRFEVQDILRHADSPMYIIQCISKIACPYYRKAMATLVPLYWHDMEQQGREPAVFLDGEGDWRITWINIDCDMRSIVKKANAEQLQLEQPNPSTPYTLHPTSPTPYTLHTTPKNNTTMPLFINRHEGTINHNEYHNCTINYAVEPTTNQAATEEPAEQAPAIPSFFRTDCHAITAIEKLWNEALQLPTKTKVIRFLQQYDHTDGYFRLNHLSYPQRAQLLNEAQDKFLFRAKDFENANN